VRSDSRYVCRTGGADRTSFTMHGGVAVKKNTTEAQRGRHARRWLRMSTVAVASAALVLTTALPAHATYYSGGMPGTTFNVKYVGVNDTYVHLFNDARSRWNKTTSTGVSLGRSSSAAASMTAGRYSASWYGLYSPSGVRGINRAFKIQVNARTLQRDSGSNFTKWIASTSTHELGHGLSLADNPGTGRASLMKHSRNRTTVYAPQAYDIEEVRRIY